MKYSSQKDRSPADEESRELREQKASGLKEGRKNENEELQSKKSFHSSEKDA